MIHDPDTLTFNSVDIYDELRRMRSILHRHDDKGLGLAQCPLEFVIEISAGVLESTYGTYTTPVRVDTYPYYIHTYNQLRT